MKFLSCEKISEHKYKTPEGYLICIDSILARTGKQTYKRREVFGVDCTDAENEVDVDRTPEEVFSDKTLASFENKPLTMEHPDEDVNIDNHNTLSVGFARDIKRGKTDKGEDVMLGTLVFTDAEAIEAIENGEMTDLSCGYDCDIVDEDNPCQRNIRGNHIALCQQGRAGIAKIVDSVKDSHYQIDMSDKEGYTHSLVVKANSHEEAKAKAAKFKPEWKYKATYQVSERDIVWAKNRGLYVDSVNDSYYTESDKKDKQFVKEALSEMRRYVSNWSFMSAKEKRNIGSLSELKARIKELEQVRDSINDNDDLPEEEDSEFLFRDAYGKEIIVTNWDGKSQFMVVYEGREQLMNRRDVEQFLDRKGARFSRVLRDSTKDTDTSRIAMANAEIDRLTKKKVELVKAWNTQSRIGNKYNCSQIDKEIDEIDKNINELKKLAYRDSTKDSLREPTSSELKKFEDYLIQRHWHVKKLGVTWTGRIHYEVSKLIGQDENEKLLMSEIHSAEYTSGLDMTYSIGSTGKELKGVVDIDKVYVRDSIKDNSTREKIEEFVSKYPGKIHHNAVVKMYENKYSCMVAPENAAFVKNELSKMGFKNIRQPDSKHVVFEDSINDGLVKTTNPEIHAWKERGMYRAQAYNRNNLDYSSLQNIARKNDVKIKESSYGYVDIISNDKSKIYKAFSEINPAITVGSWSIVDSDTYEEVTKNLKEQAKKEMRDDASFEWMRRIPDGDFEFIKGGYGMRFKDRQKYENAKRIAKQVGHTKGHWYDKDLEYFEYGSTQIGNEDSVKDSLKQFKVKYKDSKGRQIIHLVKAESLADAIKKVKDDRLAPMTYKKLKELGVSKETYSKWTQEQANKYIASKSQKSKTSEKKESNISKEEYDKLLETLGDTRYEKYLDKARIDGKYLTIDIPEDDWKDRRRLSELFSNEGFEVYESYDSVSILRKQLRR